MSKEKFKVTHCMDLTAETNFVRITSFYNDSLYC